MAIVEPVLTMMVGRSSAMAVGWMSAVARAFKTGLVPILSTGWVRTPAIGVDRGHSDTSPSSTSLVERRQ